MPIGFCKKYKENTVMQLLVALFAGTIIHVSSKMRLDTHLREVA